MSNLPFIIDSFTCVPIIIVRIGMAIKNKILLSSALFDSRMRMMPVAIRATEIHFLNQYVFVRSKIAPIENGIVNIVDLSI
ncbi:hypothetical protein NUBL21982_23720 [Klebsiella pneumoniae]|nr:hypothetical protein NUBL21982_23720 [Klebsiella pneumoniae]